MSVTSTGSGPADATDKGLQSGVPGLLSSAGIGVASTAPAYHLAATLGSVALAVGPQAPAVPLDGTRRGRGPRLPDSEESL